MPVKAAVGYTIEDMQELALVRHGRCLSPAYLGIAIKLRWQCEQGHTWDSTPSNVKAGSWCRVCSKAQREARYLEEVRALAGARGGRCLSERYVTGQTKLRWQCAKGHIWEAMPAGLRQYGSWCKQCQSESMMLTMEDMHASARERGGQCLSTHYGGVEAKLRWRCEHGHEWDTVPRLVREGRWCPTCAKQSQMFAMEEIHAMAQAHGGVCLSTAYTVAGQKLRWRCTKGHEWLREPSKVRRGDWCLTCARYPYTIVEMRALAHQRGGECLSEVYVDMQTKLRWRCDRGHEWPTTPAVIVRGHWCPECAWLARSRREKTRRKYETVKAPEIVSGPLHTDLGT